MQQNVPFCCNPFYVYILVLYDSFIYGLFAASVRAAAFPASMGYKPLYKAESHAEDKKKD